MCVCLRTQRRGVGLEGGLEGQCAEGQEGASADAGVDVGGSGADSVQAAEVKGEDLEGVAFGGFSGDGLELAGRVGVADRRCRRSLWHRGT